MVPPNSDRVSRAPPYSRVKASMSHTGLSPAPAGLSRPFRLSPVDHWPVPLSLATTDGISLMSVPPGTEMFQFPGFASYHYGFMIRYPRGWVAPFGYPRIKACSRLPMAFRSVPRPSSPPGAKASTECPYHTPIQGGSRLSPEPPTMHGNHRQRSVVGRPVASCQRQKAAAADD